MRRLIVTTLFALLVSSAAAAEEMVIDENFTSGIAAWARWWGSQFTHSVSDGHLTAAGAARIQGHTENFAGIRKCVDVTD